MIKIYCIYEFYDDDLFDFRWCWLDCRENWCCVYDDLLDWLLYVEVYKDNGNFFFFVRFKK